MTKTEEFQEMYREIERKINVVPSSDTITYFRVLVRQMLSEISSLEK